MIWDDAGHHHVASAVALRVAVVFAFVDAIDIPPPIVAAAFSYFAFSCHPAAFFLFAAVDRLLSVPSTETVEKMTAQQPRQVTPWIASVVISPSGAE